MKCLCPSCKDTVKAGVCGFCAKHCTRRVEGKNYLLAPDVTAQRHALRASLGDDFMETIVKSLDQKMREHLTERGIPAAEHDRVIAAAGDFRKHMQSMGKTALKRRFGR